MDKIVGGHFKLRRRIGAGSFGEIYSAENVHTHKRVAIKMENSRSKVPQLAYESKLYAIFSGGTGIPRLHWYGTEGSKNVMVIDLLGKSLEDLFVQCHHKFSLKTVLMLADQMISCVEFIHNKNFIHRDIKPDNFAMGLGSNSNQVFIIDYGLSKKYRDQHTHTHIPYIEGKSLTGTARYASVGALKGYEQSRRDDLESLGFVWLYLLRGNLPWMGLNGRDQRQKYNRICEVKSRTSFSELCQGFPNEFVKYFNTVRSLKFTEKPNYSELKQMFRDLFNKLGYVYDYKYDWNTSSSSTNQSKHSKHSFYSQIMSEAVKPNETKDNNNDKSNKNITRQSSTLVKMHSIPVFNESSKNDELIKSKNQQEKVAVNQSCFVKSRNIERKQSQYPENINENNSNEKEIRKSYDRNRIPQSALAANNTKEKSTMRRQQSKLDEEQVLNKYYRMNNLNSTEIRNSYNRRDRGVTQKNQNDSKNRTRNANCDENIDTPRRKQNLNSSRISNGRKNVYNVARENNARRLLMDYWIEESRNKRLASNKRMAYNNS